MQQEQFRVLGAALQGNDWGGVSPSTPDHVNPEAPWPHLNELAMRTEATGKVLVERLAVYPGYALDVQQWQDSHLAPLVLQASDSDGYARVEAWSPGAQVPVLDMYKKAVSPARQSSGFM